MRNRSKLRDRDEVFLFSGSRKVFGLKKRMNNAKFLSDCWLWIIQLNNTKVLSHHLICVNDMQTFLFIHFCIIHVSKWSINLINLTNVFLFYLPTQNQIIRAASTPATNTNTATDDDGEVKLRKKETDEVQLRRDGALNQFISELSSNIHGRRFTDTPNMNSKAVTVNDEERRSLSTDLENGLKAEQTAIESNDKVSDNSTSVERERENSQSDLLAKPSHFVTVIEVKESETATTTSPASKITTTATSSFKSVRSGYENVIIENNKRNSNLINDMDRSSNTTSSFTSSFNNVRPSAPPIALLQDSKKKIPPRWVVNKSFNV